MNIHDDSPKLEIITTRIFSASCEKVFEAFSNPEHLKHWWGPDGFTNTIHKFDLKPGGKWLLTMHGPNGKDFENESEFVEVIPPAGIVYQHLKPAYNMTMTFADEAGKTRLTWRMLFDAHPENEKLKEFLASANEQNFNRLETQLAQMSNT